MTNAIFSVRQLDNDEFKGTVVDFVPPAEEVVPDNLETRKLLMLPKATARDVCGDGTDEYQFIEPLVKWDTEKLPVKYYYSLVPMPLQKGIDLAFMEINKLYGSTFFERTLTQSEAKVTLSLNSIDVAGRTLAEASWYYSNSIITKAEIVFDSSESWSNLTSESCNGIGNVYDIGNVAMHEIGHIVGLAHAPTDRLQTMYASTTPGKTLGRSFGNGDILGFSTAYLVQAPYTNRPPVGQDIKVSIEANQEIMIHLKGTDPEGGPLTFELISYPDHGKVIFSDYDTVFYTPNQDYEGSDSFLYAVIDNKNRPSDAAEVEIEVLPPNKPPVAVDMVAEIFQNDIVNVELKATDPEGDEIKYEIVAEPINGIVEFIPFTQFSDNKVKYTPVDGFTGVDQFTYVAVDDHENISNEAKVTIVVRARPIPEPPAPPTHNLSLEQKEDIRLLRLTYEQFDKAGDKEGARKAMQELQLYTLQAILGLHQK